MTKSALKTKARRKFETSEELQAIRLKAQRYTMAYIAMRLGRSVKSVESRIGRLEATGRADELRAQLVELGALGPDA